MAARTEGRPGLVTVTFRQLSAEQIVEVAAAAGLKVLEWGGDVHVPAGDVHRAREVAAATREAGLETVCYGSYYRVGHEVEGGQAPFSAVAETAAALGAPCIRVWAGNHGSPEADEAYFLRVCSDAVRVADMAARNGLRVAFEFHEGTLNDTPGAARKLLSALPHPNLFSLWQPLLSLDRDDQDLSLRVILPRLAHVHVYQWVAGHPVDRRPLGEGFVVWQNRFTEMRLANLVPDALLEFVRGDDPKLLREDAKVLADLLAEPGRPMEP